MSLGSYIAQCRLDAARRMLGSGMSVKQVAFATGFSAPTNFAAAFRHATGLTPRLYRQLRTPKRAFEGSEQAEDQSHEIEHSIALRPD
jgi:transcriptional regulator GlxA family with amidase domain